MTPEEQAQTHELGERWQASQEQAGLQDEVRGIRVSINILIAAEKERLARIEELQKIMNRGDKNEAKKGC